MPDIILKAVNFCKSFHIKIHLMAALKLGHANKYSTTMLILDLIFLNKIGNSFYPFKVFPVSKWKRK